MLSRFEGSALVFGSLALCSFTIDARRDMRAVWSFRRLGCFACLRSEFRDGVSALFWGDDGRDMCDGSNVKGTGESWFQLESLILAQNERWRQA